MLEDEGVEFEVDPVDLREEEIRESFERDGFSPKETAIRIAEMKSRAASVRNPSALTLGCDQILEFEGKSYGKCGSLADAGQFLKLLSGKSHHLHSSAVVCENGDVVWSRTASAELAMKNNSDGSIDEFVGRHGMKLLDCVGCYMIEEGGMELFSRVDGDLSVVQGMPLVELMVFFRNRGIK